MFALRYAALLALVVWVGGLLTLGAVAAPATFDVMAARQVVDGRAVAGAVFGETLRRFHAISYGAAALLLLTLITRRILGPRPRRFGWRAGIAVLMLVSSLFVGVYIIGAIDAIRRDVGAPSSLPQGDPRLATFTRLHQLSTGLELIPILGGLALIYWELKE
jgi:uncharacterized protein DUF4149